MPLHTYYAKSEHSDGTQITVAEHLDAVAEKAAIYGEDAGISSQAKLAGLMHDFGKYSDDFQNVLSGLRTGVDHACCGGTILWLFWNRNPQGCQRAVIEAVNGHHAGLKSYRVLSEYLRASFDGIPHLTINDGKTPALSGQEQYKQALKLFQQDHPAERFSMDPWNLPKNAGNLETMLYTRMLFSCLVDADYSISAWEEDPSYFETNDGSPLDAQRCLDRLNAYRDGIRKNSRSSSVLNEIRDQIFDRCGTCGESEESGLFTLTAPTGTGKTLALLHFALRHCLAHGKRRIIIVLPFLTLAEQNAAIYEQIVPEVLVDHSQRNLAEDARELTARWSAPFIITTSVKFFEALFSSEPGECRKLHNIANSVVVFDEAQSLPLNLTEATLQTVQELCQRYRVSMVFSTATQPKFDALKGLDWRPRELLPENAQFYDALKRVDVDWRLDKPVSLKKIAAQMLEHSSVCGIFNLRRHARTVFEQLYEADPESAFLISTDLCPAHRTKVIASIRERLTAGLPCRVVSTQCIEAGVDLDFQVLYRALAPLDAIVQAAGRCNRNGSGIGQVVIFEPEDQKYPDRTYENAAKQVKRMVREKGVDIHAPADIDRYYTELLGQAHQKQELAQAIKTRNYLEVDENYKLISEAGEKLIVPYSDLSALYSEISEELKKRGITPRLMKRSAPLTITVFNRGDLESYAEQVMLRIKGKPEPVPSGYWLLRPQHFGLYTDAGGLKIPAKENIDSICSFLY